MDGNSPDLLGSSTKQLFFWIILGISGSALIANILAIISLIRREVKNLQKVFIVNLALADVFTVIVFGVTSLEDLSKPLNTWKLGEFFCHFGAMGLVLVTTTSSLSLLVIALDRYQNRNTAVSENWNPNTLQCVLLAVATWVISSATAYPLYAVFEYHPVLIKRTVGNNADLKNFHVCLATEEIRMDVYYKTMSLIIFLPIIGVSFWYYYKIALTIWPHCSRYPALKNTHSRNQTSATDTTAIPAKKKTKNVRFQTKIRTFKIVTILMITFVICRLPYWLLYNFRFTIESALGPKVVRIVYFSTVSLNIMNCFLNPLLYTFWNQTIAVVKKIKEIAAQILLWCCCFTSSDFDEFANYNLFIELDYQQEKVIEPPRNNKNIIVKIINVASDIPIHTASYSLNK